MTCVEIQPILSNIREIHHAPSARTDDIPLTTGGANGNQQDNDEDEMSPSSSSQEAHHHYPHHVTTKCRTKNERKLMLEILELKKENERSKGDLKTIQLELQVERSRRQRLEQETTAAATQHVQHQNRNNSSPSHVAKTRITTETTTIILEQHMLHHEKAWIQFQAIWRGARLRKKVTHFIWAMIIVQSHVRGRQVRRHRLQSRKEDDVDDCREIEKILGFQLVLGTNEMAFHIQWNHPSPTDDEPQRQYWTKDALSMENQKVVECYERQHQGEILKMMPIAVSMYPECTKTHIVPLEEEQPATPEIEEDIDCSEEEECEVELIVDHRLIEDETLEYRVCWTGSSSPDEDEWFSREDLVEAGGNTPILLHTYEKNHHQELHQWLTLTS